MSGSEQTDEYTDGRLAYWQGKTADDNPYAIGNMNAQRIHWFDGFYAERGDEVVTRVKKRLAARAADT